MVVAMLLCLFIVSVSGPKAYAIEEGLGPLAGETPVVSIIGPAYTCSLSSVIVFEMPLMPE